MPYLVLNNMNLVSKVFLKMQKRDIQNYGTFSLKTKTWEKSNIYNGIRITNTFLKYSCHQNKACLKQCLSDTLFKHPNTVHTMCKK